jgi:DNA-binding GntR family transcriptional regulator
VATGVRRVRVVSVVEAIHDDLRDQILSGELAPGAPLTEADVAARYDVARPTAKAAIERLVVDRLVVRSTHKTARVRRLGPDDARDIYRTRATIEAEVLRQLALTRTVPEGTRELNDRIRAVGDGTALAVVAPDMAFHTALIDGLRSERTSRVYRSLASEVTLCMAQVQGRNLLPTALIVAEHDGLLDLVAAGDGEAAAALLGVHLGRARERLVGALGGTPGPEAELPPTVPLPVLGSPATA